MPRVTITVPEKNAQPYRFALDREVVTLGRGSENDIAIDCGSISVKHAEMCRIKGGYQLRDLGSTNGIKRDGERLDVIPLHSGMSVRLGDVAFDFELSDDERALLAQEGPEQDESAVREPGESAGGEPHVASHRPYPSESSGGGFGMVLLFLVLAAAAFAAGMAIRFQKDTHTSLLDAIKGKGEHASAPAKPEAPDAGAGEETDAPDGEGAGAPDGGETE